MDVDRFDWVVVSAWGCVAVDVNGCAIVFVCICSHAAVGQCLGVHVNVGRYTASYKDVG